MEAVEAGSEVSCTAVAGFEMRAKKDCDLIERFRAFWHEVEVEGAVMVVVRRT